MPTTATDAQIPAGLPVLPGAALAGRYVMSGVEPLNKGDTLDALPLPDDRVGLVVADVVGNGLGSAMAVSQIKAVLRERLCDGSELRDVMVSADRYASTHPELCATTIAVVVLGLRDGGLEWSVAGHPPPIRMTPGSAPQYLQPGSSRPLGTGGEATTQRSSLAVGDMVGVYTNGLVHAPGQSLGEGYRRLADAFAGASDPRAPAATAGVSDDACAHIMRETLSQGASDDAALLIATRADFPQPFRLRLAAIPENLPLIRHRINEWLDGLGAGLMDHVGLGHAVVELAANVVAHAYVDVAAEPVVLVEALLGTDGVVSVTVADHGRWRIQSSQGRGLMMAAGLAEGIQVDRSSGGTTVTLTQRLTRPVPLLREVIDRHHTLDDADEFETRVDPGWLVASGAIDELSVELFDAALSKATRAGTADAVIDLAGITHLGSPGVQTLFDFLGRCRRTGSTMSLRAPAGSPAGQILALVGLPPGVH